MNAKQKWILGVAAFVLLLVIAGFGYQELQKEAKRQERSQTGKQIQTEEQTQTEEKKGTEYAKAPDFIMWDQQGDQTSLQEILEGKPAVINFWTSKCPPCKEEMPDFE